MNSINCPASLCMGLHSSARRAMQHKCRGHGIKSRWSPEKPFFGLFHSWRRRSITICILCQILVCFFFSSKWAEFLHVLPDLIESHSPVFFYAGLRFVFQLKRMQKKSAALFAACCWMASKRNLLFSQKMKPAKRPVATCFLHTFLLKNEAQTSRKKYRAVTFY